MNGSIHETSPFGVGPVTAPRDLSKSGPVFPSGSRRKSDLPGRWANFWAKAADLLPFSDKRQTQSNLRQVYLGRAVTALKSNDLKSFNEFAKLAFAAFPSKTPDKEKITIIEKSVQEALQNRVSDRALVRIARQTDWRGFDRPMMKLFANAFEAATKPENRIIDDQISGEVDVQKVARLLKSEFADDITINVDERDLNQYKYLGGGAKNAVYKVTYKEEGKEKVKVFKPLKEGEKADRLSPGALGGIPRKKPEFLHLAVASSKVCKLFDFGNRYVKTNFATVNGKRGIVMDLAPGAAPKVTGEVWSKFVSGSSSSPTFGIEQDLLEDHEKGKLSNERLKGYAGLLGCRRLKVDNNEIYRLDATHSNFKHDNAKMRKELTELQLLDVICGQMDRHPENYYVAEDGGVCGIDNDLAFGTRHTDINQARNLGRFLWMPNRGSLLVNAPSIIDYEMFKKVVGVPHDSTHETIRTSIEGKVETLRIMLAEHMTSEQVDAAITRYTQLAEYCVSLKENTNEGGLPKNKGTGYLIGEKDWERADVRDSMMNRDGSYFGREMLVLKPLLDDIGKWNHLR